MKPSNGAGRRAAAVLMRRRERLSGPPTLAQVATYAGVSRQTVSNAINNPDLLRPSTLSRVRAAIDELGYSPNRAARNLRTQASHLIGLRFAPTHEGTANALMDRFVHSLVEASQAVGYHVLLFAGDPDRPEIGYDDLVRSNAVDGFVVTDTFVRSPHVAWLADRGIPFVAFGRPWGEEGAAHAWVDVDGAAGVEMATRHLIDRGHRRIAWVGWHRESFIGEDRRSGWSRAMHVAGLTTTGMASRGEDAVRSGVEASAVLLDEAEPTAFVCASDTLAMGVLHTLHERGLRVGHDISVVGFDDSQPAQVLPPGLTSVRQPLEQVAVHVVAAVRSMFVPPRASGGVLLTPTLVVRRSSSFGHGAPGR
ncbi:MAG: LacI family DNA-binding transcriptional regulator [Nocardioides sp.]